MAAAAGRDCRCCTRGGRGAGPWGDLVRAALTAEGIGLLRPPDPSRDTGFDVALVEPDAERTFVTSLGAESASEAGSWDAVPAGPGDAVYVSGYGLVPPGSGPALGAWAAAPTAGALLFFDPGPLAAQIPDEVLDPVLARCDWLSCNAREAALLSGATAPRRRPAACSTAPPAPASSSASDRTAASWPPGTGRTDPCTSPPRGARSRHHRTGDAHSGVFLAALADGLSAADAARRANAAAALAVTRPGPPPARTGPSWTPGSPGANAGRQDASLEQLRFAARPASARQLGLVGSAVRPLRHTPINAQSA